MVHVVNISITVESDDIVTSRAMKTFMEKIITDNITVQKISVEAWPFMTPEIARMCAEDRRAFEGRYYERKKE